VLLVAATRAELGAFPESESLCCGLGPVEAALATARALAEHRPEAVLHVGIAGARSLAPPALVLGREAVYVDLEPELRLPHHRRVEPDPRLLAAARAALPQAHVAVIATSARVGGAPAYEVEAMEGFGVLRAAAEAGVPALELRAISNGYTDPRSAWQITAALEALAGAVAALQEAFGA